MPDGLWATIVQLSTDDQHLFKRLPLVGLCSGAPEIAYVLLWQPFQPHTQGLPLQPKSYKSFVRVTDGIHLPTVHPLWPSKTLTLSHHKKYPSSSRIIWVHCLVL
jgi:hypothetical protein